MICARIEVVSGRAGCVSRRGHCIAHPGAIIRKATSTNTGNLDSETASVGAIGITVAKHRTDSANGGLEKDVVNSASFFFTQKKTPPPKRWGSFVCRTLCHVPQVPKPDTLAERETGNRAV